MRASQQVFRRLIKIEQSQLFYWLPALFGAGMALYYALKHEPGTWLYTTPLLFLPAFLLWRIRYLSQTIITACTVLTLCLALIGSGAAYAKWRTSLKDVRLLATPLSIRPIEGVVDTIEHLEHGLRITLSDIKVAHVDAKTVPKRVRVSLRAKTVPDIEIGQRISLRAALLPPSGPVMENAFDFSRYFFFRGIGAVGYALMPITVLEPSTHNGFFAFWRNARDHLTARIHAYLPGIQGAIASGLITGDDSAIPQTIYEELRAANLIHIIAISGSHLVVIAGIIFICLRSVLVFIPHYGLRPYVKQMVAILTWVAISCYLAITGFELSAVRAHVMLSLLLFAVVLCREVYAMRSIALAAIVMLIFDPSDIIEPGFQLSFAATFALIAAFDSVFKRRSASELRIIKLFDIISFMFLTTFIAEMATAPFVIFHFNNFALYGVIANLVLSPVVTLIIMPMVALYFVLLPLGAEAVALHIIAYGIDAMLWVAHVVSSWPYALRYIPSLTPYGIVASTFGLLWVCIWKTRMRWLGVPMMAAGIMTSALFNSPDVLLSSRLQQVAYRSEKGYVLLHGVPRGLFAKLWANGVGQEKFLTLRQAQPLQNIHCTRGGCTLEHNDTRIHFSYTVPDIKLGCPDVDWWMSGYFLYPKERATCKAHTRFLDRADFDSKGSAWGWFNDKGLELEFTRNIQGNRPWSVGYRSKQ